MSAVFLVGIWLLLIALSVHSARKRGRDPVVWGVLCGLLWIIFYPLLLIVGETSEHRLAMIREDEEVRRQVQRGGL